MTGLFDDIKLGWKGKTYIIPPRKVIEAIAIVEEIITLQELTEYARRGSAPIARLASAYARVLEFAGCKVDASEVYEGMFDGALSDTIATSINTLLMMMIPPRIRAALNAGEPLPKPVLGKGETEADVGNLPAPGKGARSAGSRSRSASAGSRRRNSGG
jgi:hypothetical protein